MNVAPPESSKRSGRPPRAVTGDSLEERVRAVERAVTDGETSVAALADAASVHERLADIESRLDALESRTDALDATVQSLHGYVGEIEAVNEDVARRADAARAAVERLEADRQRLESAVERPSEAGAVELAERAAEDGEPSDDTLLDRVRESL
jgi:chromosome segregation ATPase